MIKNIIIFSAIVIYSLFLSLLLPARNWETDYGSYYSLAMFLDNKNILYENMFSHSGPVFFFILKIIGYFIGWGWRESIVTYSIINITLFSSIYFFCTKLKINTLESIIILILYISFQKYFGTNVILQNFFNIFLIFYALFLYFFIDTLQKKFFYISIFFLSFLILTRIDGVIYCIIAVLFYFFYILKSKENIKFFLKDIFISFFIFIFIFIFFKIFFGYKIESYFYHNVIFNLEYGSLNHKFNIFQFYLDLTPKKLTLAIIFCLLTSLLYDYFYNKEKNLYKLIILFLFLNLFLLYEFNILKYYIYFIIFILIFIISFILSQKEKVYKVLFFSFGFYTISVFIFNYAGAYKLYYSAMLHPSYIFLIISSIHFIKIINSKNVKTILLLILIFFVLDQYKKHFYFTKREIFEHDSIKYEYGVKNYFYNKKLIYENKLIIYQKKNNLKVICGRGWINVFSNNKSEGNMYDWWYFTDIFFNTHYFKKDYENFIKKKGEEFFIDLECVKQNKKIKFSSELKFILLNSDTIGNFTFFNNQYQLRKLNKNL